ncbi:MAG: YceI family protein [Bacteroidota bacterium]
MKLAVVTIALWLLVGATYGQEYKLAENSNTINWRGYSEVGDFAQEGTIDIKSSSIVLDVNGRISGEIVINMKSIYHEDKRLNSHLKKEDFFDVKKFPTATFKFAQNDSGAVSGELLMKGATGTLTFTPTIKTEQELISVDGDLEIDRTKYGIKYNSSSYFQDLGNYAIKNNFDISFQLKYTIAN